MTKIKKQTKRRKGQSASKAIVRGVVNRGADEVDDLYAAVISFVEARGGKAIVIGGISVIQWPGDRQDNFMVGVRVTGAKPTKLNTPNAGAKRHE